MRKNYLPALLPLYAPRRMNQLAASEWCAYTEYLMKRQGVSQTDLAVAIGYSQPGARGFLKGETLPPLDKMPQIAKVLHLDEDERAKLLELAQAAVLPGWVMAELRTLRGALHAATVKQTELEVKLERVLGRRIGEQPLGKESV